MTKTYFVKLTPMQLFFFGGEQGITADYYLKGSFFPQQTALLGLVRHQVLVQNHLLRNNIIRDDAVAADWIGKKSFEFDKENCFEKVVNLSPCYLVKTKEDLLVKYLPYYQPYAKGITKVDANFFLPEFDPKNNYPDIWVSVDKQESIYNKNDFIFKEVERIGVDRNYSGTTQDKSFFKQLWLKMTEGFSFGFYVTIGADVKFTTNHVLFGKESASFLMEVAEEQIEEFADEAAPTALLLTSDAYVSKDIISSCDFAVTDTVPFRNIINITSKNNNYYGLQKSIVRLQLFKRGSLFFSKNNLTDIKVAINSHANFRTIGYNHFHLVNIPY